MSLLSSLGLSASAVAKMTGSKIQPVKPVNRKPQTRCYTPPLWAWNWVLAQPEGRWWTLAEMINENKKTQTAASQAIWLLYRRGTIERDEGKRGPVPAIWVRTGKRGDITTRPFGAHLSFIADSKEGEEFDVERVSLRFQGAMRAALVKARRKGLVKVARKGERVPTVYKFRRVET